MNASGRDDTAAADALLNGMAMTLALAVTFNGVTAWQLTPNMVDRWMELSHLAAVGDDCVAATPGVVKEGTPWGPRQLETLRTEVATFGFIAEIGHANRWLTLCF